MKRALILVGAVLIAGCGSVSRMTGAATPSPHAPSPTSAVTAAPATTPSASPSAAAATRLTITGALAASVAGATAAGTCGRTPNGDGADLRFAINGHPYSLAIELGSYHGPGVYPLPPDRVSLHTLTIGPGSQFFGSQSGSVTVATGDASGSLDVALKGDAGDVHVAGTWSCAG